MFDKEQARADACTDYQNRLTMINYVVDGIDIHAITGNAIHVDVKTKAEMDSILHSYREVHGNYELKRYFTSGPSLCFTYQFPAFKMVFAMRATRPEATEALTAISAGKCSTVEQTKTELVVVCEA